MWRAHKGHLYQRMVAGGLGHTRTALVAYGVMAVSAGVALVGNWIPRMASASLAGAWLAMIVALYCPSGEGVSAGHDEAALFDRTVGSIVPTVDARLRIRPGRRRLRLARWLSCFGSTSPFPDDYLALAVNSLPWVLPIYAVASWRAVCTAVCCGSPAFPISSASHARPRRRRDGRAGCVPDATRTPDAAVGDHPVAAAAGVGMGGARAVYRQWRDGQSVARIGHRPATGDHRCR